MRKLVSLLMMMTLVSSLLVGCGNTNNTVQEATAENGSVAEVEEKAEEVMAEVMPAENNEVSFAMPDTAESSNILILGDIAFFMSDNCIMSVSSLNGESNFIWQDEDYDKSSSESRAFSGKGILLYDKIYFCQSKETRDEEGVGHYNICLNKINIDGTGFENIAEYQDASYEAGDMYFADEVLYVIGDGKNDCFKIDKEGNIVEKLDRQTMNGWNAVPENYVCLPYTNNGYRTLNPAMTYRDCKKLIMANEEYNPVIYDVASKRATAIGGYCLSYNGAKLLVYDWDMDKKQDNYIIGTIDMKTGEYKLVNKASEYPNVISMDKDYYYIAEGKDIGPDTTYKRISLDNGKEEVIFTTPRSETSLLLSSLSCCLPLISNDRIYAAYLDNYSLKPVVTDIKTGEMTIASDCVYDAGIGKVGKLDIKSNNVTADDGTVVCNYQSCILNVDEKFPGAEAINEVLNRWVVADDNSDSDEAKEALEWYETSKTDEDGGYFAEYSLSYSSDIVYFDGDILSVIINGYVYMGGAHGMPMIRGYIFDLNTGEQLGLDHYVTISEDEFKELVCNKFADVMLQNGGTECYWEEAPQTVHDRIGFNFDAFYLTEDGLCFYFPPYDLASYAQGFQYIIVPLDELKASEE